jgi:hypothetical protein
VAETQHASTAENPKLANALVSQALQGTETPLPEPPAIEQDEIVQLPGGLMIAGDGGPKLISSVQVRELTGADEERLAKASASKSAFHFLNTLLECGVARIGDEDPASYPRLLKQMLIGDRDAVIFGIRRMTYGPTLEIQSWLGCPHCGEASDISLDLFNEDDIPVKRLENGVGREFDVDLRRGQVAHARLLTGEDQTAIGEMLDRSTNPERDTFILTHAVTTLTDKDGRSHLITMAPSLMRNLGLQDRRTLLKEITDRQPGPKYSDIKFIHPPCGKEVSMGLTLADLFLG